MLGKLQIMHLPLSVIIGVYDKERLAPQSIFVDLTLFYDCQSAVEKDAIAQALDYDRVVDQLHALAHALQPILIETFAIKIAEAVLYHFSLCQRIMVSVHKPQAIPAAEDVIFSIERVRDAQ